MQFTKNGVKKMGYKQDYKKTIVVKNDIALMPPQNRECEEAVLGACLLERDAFDTVLEIVPREDCFYVEAHQRIYAAMIALNTEKQPIDLLTVTSHLRDTNQLELIGGAYYLTKIASAVLSSAHAETHARIVMEKFFARETIRIANELIYKAYRDGEYDIFDTIEEGRNILSITDLITKDNFLHISDYFTDVAMEVETIAENKDVVLGIETGFDLLNQATNGWQKGNHIILAARPGRGKTAFALNLAANANLYKPCNVLIFSIEMTGIELTKRMIATKCQIDFGKVQRGTLEPHERKILNDAYKDFQKLPIMVDDSTNTLRDIIGSCRKRKKAGKPIDMIIIDYLQLIRHKASHNSNREQDVSEISRELKSLAKEMKCPVISLAQLNRGIESRSDEPKLSDLRESGSIEQDAEIVAFLHGQNTGRKDDAGIDIIDLFLIIAKNRNGKTTKIKMKFAGEYQKWMLYDDSSDNVQNNYFNPNAGFQNQSKRYDTSDWRDD